LFYLSCTLFRPFSLGMTVSDLSFLYLAGPYPWNTGDVWFIFLLWVLALWMIYMFACLKMVMHFVWWTHMVRRVTLSWSWVLLTLECGYALRAIVVCAYSCYILCMIIIVWLSRSMSASARVCDVHQHVWCFGELRLALVWTYWRTPYT